MIILWFIFIYPFAVLYRITANLFNKKSGFKKILVTRFEHIGDVILTTPLLHALKQRYPSSKISIAIGEWTKDVVSGNSSIDEVIIFNHPFFNRNSQQHLFQDIMSILVFIKKIFSDNFDLIIDLRSYLSTLLLTYSAFPRQSAGYNFGWKSRILSIRTDAFLDHYEVERHQKLLTGIGINDNEIKFEFQISNADNQYANKIIQQNNDISKDGFIAIHLSAPWLLRRWELNRFVEISDWIITSYRIGIVIIGTREDEALFKEFLDKLPPQHQKYVLSCTGKTTIKQLGAVLTKAILYLGVDSGPMHIAVAVGTPVICLMGPGSYPRFAPFGKNNIVIRKELDCNYLDLCKQTPNVIKCQKETNECMKSITVEEVRNAVIQLLSLNKSTSFSKVI
jgi:ADP-heptose:LPS heptosyltransferase